MSATILFLLRGVRWRLGLSLLTVLTAAIAVGAAVVGPLYLWTAGDSVLRTAVGTALVEHRGATVTATPGGSATLGQVEGAERAVARVDGPGHWYRPPITSVISGVGLSEPHSGPVRSQLLARTGICRVLHFEAGGCESGFGDVAISDRSARELGVSLGTVIGASVPGASRAVPLRITGIYSVPNLYLPYWWGNGIGYFSYGHVTGGPKSEPEVDSLITSPATALAVPARDAPVISAQLPLRVGNVGLGQESALRRAVTAASRGVTAHGLILRTQLPSVLAGADRQRHVMATIVAVAAIQLVLLAIWVLAGLLLRSADARRPEMRVARLRGFPPLSMLAATTLEPATLCTLGLLLGIAAAWGAVVLARNRVLDPAATLSADVWVFAALGATVVAIAIAIGLGARRVLRGSGLSESSTIARATYRRSGLIADTVLLVLSVVALIALATNGNLSGHSNPIASAAPGLIALGAAVIAVQLVLIVCRAGIAAGAFSGRVSTFLALRQIVRRPAVMRQTRVLIIALGLACFAVSAWSVARSNRAAAATFAVGSSRVATVTPHGVGLVQAVARVDPRGRFAMAAIALDSSGHVQAVDVRRLGAVMPWPQGVFSTSLVATARRLNPPTAPSVNLPGAPVRLTALTALSALTASTQLRQATRYLDVDLWVFNPQAGTSIISLGHLHRGAFTYGASLAAACPGGCRLAGLGVVPAAGSHAGSFPTVALTVTDLSAATASGTWRPVPGDLFQGGWRAGAAGVQVQTHAGGGLTFIVPGVAAAADSGAEGFATPPMASPADVPTVLPGAVTTEMQALNGGGPDATVPAQGLDGSTLNVRPAVVASALPRAGGDAVMVDLALLLRDQSGPTTAGVTDEVWLGPHAPGDALARLQSAGLQIEKVQRASTVFHQLQQSAPALADDFLLLATIVALLAAAASTLETLGGHTRERATELTVLEVGGVPRRALAGSLALEAVVLAVTALVGAGAGVLAAIMAIPSLPELARQGVIPLQYGLPGGLIAAVAAAVVAVILLASGVVAAVVMRRMSPLLLRIAPNDSA